MNERGYNPKDLIGMTKAPLRLVPPALVIETAKAMAEGARKYGPYNWRTDNPVRMSIYLEALERHLQAFRDGENNAIDSGVSHLSHMAACLAIIMDAWPIGQLVDDRPPKGPAAQLLALQIEDGTVKKETAVENYDERIPAPEKKLPLPEFNPYYTLQYKD